MSRPFLTQAVIWGYSFVAAFLLGAFGISLMGDPKSLVISGEMSGIATILLAVVMPLHGALLLSRKAI